VPEWSREHDRVIAEKCEEITVYAWDDLMPVYASVEEPSWPNRAGCELHRKRIPDELFSGKHPSMTIPHYSTELHAIFRATEAWIDKNPDHRWMEIGRYTCDTDGKYLASLAEIWLGDPTNYHGKADTVAAALAWALYKAVSA